MEFSTRAQKKESEKTQRFPLARPRKPDFHCREVGSDSPRGGGVYLRPIKIADLSPIKEPSD